MKLEYKINNNKYFNVKDVLKSQFEISDRLLTILKKENKIFLNGATTYINTLVSLGDMVSVELDLEEAENENIIATKIDFDILYEDEALLIINKSHGIAIHPSILHYSDTLSNAVKYYFESISLKRKIRPVNRLDKDTSGIVIFAKNQYIQEALIKQMKSQKFEKKYYAILSGNLEVQKGTINAPITRKANSIIEREISCDGETAITHFELQKNFKYNNINLCLVKFTLETGRTHQIRLHSKHIGHPILGDSLYASSSTLISRQALHAYEITFIHPITKEKIKINAPIPEDMNKIIANKN